MYCIFYSIKLKRSYLFDNRFAFTKAQIFLVISLGAIGFLPNTSSTVSFRPEKLIAYPPNAFFFPDDLDFLAVDFDLLDFDAVFFANFLKVESFINIIT